MTQLDCERVGREIIYLSIPGRDARCSRRCPPALPVRFAAGKNGGPPFGVRPGTIQPRRNAHPRQNRATKLQRLVSPPSHLEIRTHPATTGRRRTGMAVAKTDSYTFCRRIARTRARNFYYSFLLLSPEQRDAMCAIYAFMRYCDDISEAEGASREAIERWRSDLKRALHSEYAANPLWPAFQETVERYRIPHNYFQEMIDGVSSDMEPRQIQTFDELYRYC